MKLLSVLFASLICIYAGPPLPPLGNLSNYGILAATTVTNTGNSIVAGNVGVYPGSAIVGFPPGIAVFPGAVITDATENMIAQEEANALNIVLLAAGPSIALTGDLATQILVAGVYSYTSSAMISGAGILTLDGGGNSSSVWIFQIGSTLTTGTSSSVVMINQGSPCNVFWSIGSSATFQTTTTWVGTVVATVSITFVTGATLLGAGLALTGAVTMDTNGIAPCLDEECPCTPCTSTGV